MAWPQLLVQVAFADNPLTANAANTWTDITAYVLSFQSRRGRSDALARIEAGTAILTLDNSDRRFDPTYASSPYYPNVVPMRKLRISATYSAVTSYLFTGYVETWPPDWPGGLDATTTIQCVDAFKYFALKRLNGSYTDEYTNWAIDTQLDAIDWPAADQNFFAGQSQIQPGTFVNTPALQHFQNAADVESGLFFMDGQGRATFHNRHYRLTNSVASAATFGDILDGTELPWLAAAARYDDTNLWNEARITRTGGTEQVATDAASQAAYFARTYTKTLPVLTDAEALSLAQWIVGRYSAPLFQFVSITLDGLMSDSLWPHMLGRTIGERITVVERPPGGAGTISQECYIEGVAMDVAADHWTAIFQVSPADALTYWVLEHATLGVLDVTTRLAY